MPRRILSQIGKSGGGIEALLFPWARYSESMMSREAGDYHPNTYLVLSSKLS